jgi:hypothetical protein
MAGGEVSPATPFSFLLRLAKCFLFREIRSREGEILLL